MVFYRLSLCGIAALIHLSSTQAREVVNLRFERTIHHSEFGSAAATSVSQKLRTYFQSSDKTIGEVTPEVSETPLAQGFLLSNPLEQSFIPDLRPTSSCIYDGYSPTWWLSPEVETRRAAYHDSMANIACESGIPVKLLDALIAQESGYNGSAISRVGAIGMMQIMPGTARNLNLQNPWDALANMRAGAMYLRQQLDRFRRVDLALAAYNAGPERRSLARGYVPAIPETRNYVRTITTNWLRLTQLNRPDSSVLARAAAASVAVRASGYREVSLVTYAGTNTANPI